MPGYGSQKRRNQRLVAVGVAVTLLVVLGVLFARLSQQRSDAEQLFVVTGQAVLSGDYVPMRDSVKTLGQQLAADDRAPGSLLALDVRAELAVSLLYTGSLRQRERAVQLLALAKQRAPQDPEVWITEAFVEASLGDPAIASELLRGPQLSGRFPQWERIAQAEADRRRGVAVDAQALAAGATTGLLRVWALRIAWAQGDVEAVGSLSALVLSDSPGNTYASTLSLLAAARLDGDGEATDRLSALLSSGAQIPAVLGSLAAIDLTRLMRRQGDGAAAGALLLDLAEQDPESLVLQAELARSERFLSHFGVAFDRADKALRASPADGDLLAEMSAALFFRDSAEKIESRLRSIPDAQQNTGGVRRARALAALLRGDPGAAIEGLSSTRHLGQPGDAELWLAEAHLQADNAEEALREARRARELLVLAYGAPSHATVIADLYVGLSLQGLGQTRPARAVMESAYVRPYQTPWAAWLYGRFLENEGAARKAKDLYLLACHHGQDFALSCYSLSRIYQSLRLDAVERSTQRKARELYLRTSPSGVHAVEVRAALSAG